MKNKLTKSLKIDATQFSGKKAKTIYSMIRCAVIQEHGFKAIKGLTDKRLAIWPVIIRFHSENNRSEFINTIGVLKKTTLKKLKLKNLIPISPAPREFKFSRSYTL